MTATIQQSFKQLQNMSEPLSSDAIHAELKSKIAAAALDDAEAHRDIWDFIENNSKALFDSNETIPLHALTYAIRRVLYPDFVPDRIPDLLKYLWHVDAIRRRAVLHAEQIITWQDYYEKDSANNEEVVLLTASEKRKVAKFADGSAAKRVRDAYCECAIRCCRYHIYYLCTAESHLHLLPKYLTEYFPKISSHQNVVENQVESFHWDFSEDEHQRLNIARAETVHFLKTESEWERDREAFWQKRGYSKDTFYTDPFQEEFAANFPPPFEIEDLVGLVDAYLKMVEKMVETLESLFPDQVPVVAPPEMSSSP